MTTVSLLDMSDEELGRALREAARRRDSIQIADENVTYAPQDEVLDEQWTLRDADRSGLSRLAEERRRNSQGRARLR